MIAEYRERPTDAPRIVVQVDVGAILAGTHLRGSLAERLRGLQEEVRASRRWSSGDLH